MSRFKASDMPSVDGALSALETELVSLVELDVVESELLEVSLPGNPKTNVDTPA